MSILIDSLVRKRTAAALISLIHHRYPWLELLHLQILLKLKVDTIVSQQGRQIKSTSTNNIWDKHHLETDATTVFWL